MITLDVKTDIAKALAPISVLEPRQFPFIASLAINRTLTKVREVEKKALASSFDRPTSRTVNALFTRPSNKQNLTAFVALKDDAPKGTAPEKYLQAQIEGGGRRLKRFEKALQYAGILPQGMYAVPAKGFPVNAYGNIPSSYIVRMLSALKAFSEVGYDANRTTRSSKRNASRQQSFFAVKPDDYKHTGLKLPLGVYQKQGNTARMVIAFVRAPNYRKRLPYFQKAEQTVREQFPIQLRGAIEQAMRTSRNNNAAATARLLGALV